MAAGNNQYPPVQPFQGFKMDVSSDNTFSYPKQLVLEMNTLGERVFKVSTWWIDHCSKPL